MKREYIHIIMRHTGDYEDARSEPVCALKDKTAADKLAERMRTAAEKVCDKMQKLSDAYFSESDGLINTPAEKAWRKYGEIRGTCLDREWEREVDPPVYTAHRLLIREG